MEKIVENSANHVEDSISSYNKSIHTVEVENNSGKNEEILKTIFDNAKIGITYLNREGKILNVNNEILNLFGYSKKEILSSTVEQITHPDDYQKDLNLFNQILCGNIDHYTIEKRYISKNGNIIHGKLTLYKINNDNEKDVNFIAFVEDLTNKKLISQKLSEEQNLLTALLHSTTDNIYFKDLNSCFIKVNEATSIKLGFDKPEDLIGKSDFDIFGHVHANEAINDEKEIINTAKPIINKEEKEEWPDGRITWAETSKIPYYDEEGNISGIIGITRDITEKKKSEMIREVLYEISEATYNADDIGKFYALIHKAIQKLMPAKNFYIALFDEKTGLLSFPYFVDEFDPAPGPRKLGKGLTEYVLKNGEALLANEEKDKQLRDKGKVELVGSQSPVWLGIPLKLREKTIGVIVVQDYKNPEAYGEDEMQILNFISEQTARVIENKINAEEIKKYTNELIEINRTKDKFFSIIAHDLRSPFNGLFGLIEILTEADSELSLEEREEYTNELSTLLKNQYELLQNLLRWATMQLNKTMIKFVKLNMYELIRGKIELFKENAHKKNIKIKNELRTDTMVLCDPNMTGSVIHNLISNAIKFTRHNGFIKISSIADNGFIKITVQDNGVGIKEETLENIFRLDSVHTSKGTEGEMGSGLGLMLCREMIEKQGGKINISTKINFGTKVSFTLPFISNE